MHDLQDFIDFAQNTANLNNSREVETENGESELPLQKIKDDDQLDKLKLNLNGNIKVKLVKENGVPIYSQLSRT